MTGIYVIICWVDFKLYVGSSLRMRERMDIHKTLLRGEKHHNIHLQRAWNKYGEAAFEFGIYKEMPGASVDELLGAERELWADWEGDRFNLRDPFLTPTADLSVAAKIGAAMKGNRYGEANKGRTFSLEWRAKLSAAAKRRTISPEARAKMSASHKTSEVARAQRAKLHRSNVGRKLA